MIKLLRFMRGYFGLAIAAPFFMLLEVVMDLMQPTLMAGIIDYGVAKGDVAFIWSTGLKMMTFTLIGMIGGAGCIITSAYAGIGFSSRLRQAVFDRIQTFSFAEIDRFKTGSLITRLTNDITQVEQVAIMSMRIMVRAPLMSIGSMIMAYRLSRSLSVAFLIAIPVMLAGALAIMTRTMPLFMTMQEKIDRVNTVMRENLLGVKVIRSFVNQQKEERRFGQANRDLKDWSIKAMEIVMLLFPMVHLVINFSIVAVLWFGGKMAMVGSLEIGKIMAFINYLIQIMSSVMMVIMVSINFSRAKVSAFRLNEVLETESTIKEPEEGTVNRRFDIEFKDVSYRHHNTREWILKNISFTVAEGEKVGIIGPTGSGKTTLVSLIPRLYDATAGQVLIGGVDVRQIPFNVLRRKVGMVLQESILFADTLEENMRFARQEATAEEMASALKDAQAWEFVREKPEGLLTRVEQRGRNFSGGQKQRLSPARTLLLNPDILILDDSTSAVDLVTESNIQKAISKRMGHCTLIIIAQRIASLMKADKIIVLDEGRISAIGSHEELLKTSSLYRQIAVSQLGEEVLADVSF